MASSLSGEAGIGMIDCTMSVSRPTVFKVTVFPPVLGPVITTIRASSPKERVIGTTLSSARRGWRASIREMESESLGNAHL